MIFIITPTEKKNETNSNRIYLYFIYLMHVLIGYDIYLYS
jgi:hypothetical protein